LKDCRVGGHGQLPVHLVLERNTKEGAGRDRSRDNNTGHLRFVIKGMQVMIEERSGTTFQNYEIVFSSECDDFFPTFDGSGISRWVAPVLKYINVNRKPLIN
jgi:hypothetical protein